jgi:pyruvate/2-oxoglutarate dehydrogenase complex dihydrolipoamide dehydrogenase (E3) component
VILGSGDIGLIMARRMRLLGAHVVAVVELRPWPSGLARNIAQCLDDFSIPLILGHRTLDILGRDRVEGVRIVPLDGGRPDMTRTRILACDTVLLSVGLVPECELLHAAGIPLCPETGGPLVDPDGRTAAPGIYACGNALAVHDLVDHVSAGAEATAGAIERRLAAGEGTPVLPTVRLTPGNGVRSVVPQTARVGEALEIAIRALSPMANARATARTDDGRIRAGQACRWVNPAEMLRFHLAEGTVDGPLEISLEEA